MIVFRPKSSNSKLSPVRIEKRPKSKTQPRRVTVTPVAPFVCSTYAPIEQSCPKTCTFFAPDEIGDRPCYADAGFTRSLVRRIEEASVGLSPIEVAALEARAINNAFQKHDIPQDGARGGRDLRLHVSGDARTNAAARLLGGAATGWRARKGGSVWTYTHAWRTVDRMAWGSDVSVLASIEHPRQADKARERGYAPAIVVDAHPGDRAFNYEGLKVVPCPAETHETTCVECRLCLDRDLLKLGIAIGFSAHGASMLEVRRRLPILYPTPIERLAAGVP